MKSIKALAVVMALTAASVLTAGCGGGQADSQSAAASSEKAAAAVTEEPKAAEEAKPTEAPKAEEVAKPTEAPKAEAEPEAAQAADTAGKSDLITEEEVMEIVLKDAGFKPDEVVFKQVKLETDDGITFYDVVFYAADTEYEYDVDPETGGIIKAETDPMDAEDYAEMEALSGKKAGDQPEGSGITEEEALKTALEAAGVSEADVTATEVHLDYDDETGITEYDVDIYVGNTEYCYSIDPVTGEILSSEVDYDD